VLSPVVVFAQKSTPTPTRTPGEDLAVHLKLRGASCNTNNLTNILAAEPWKSNKDRFKVNYTDSAGNLQKGGNYPEEDEPPGGCVGNRHMGQSGNVTQHFTFTTGTELAQFISAVELK
jgi:hypothetical protein